MRLIEGTNHWDHFWAKVAVGDCWEWQGGVINNGYGRFSAYFPGPPRRIMNILAHRLSWETLVGSIPEGLDLDHICRNRLCVNPDHLEPVTRSENIRRGRRGRHRDRCGMGHDVSIAKNRVNGECRHCLGGRQKESPMSVST